MKNIVIVDESDNLITFKERGTLGENDIYRVAALWIVNSKGDILLARRHKNKSHNPRKWGPAVAGTVEEGETYEENIIKETEEELGLKEVSPKLGPKTKTGGEHKHFTQWYVLILDKDIGDFNIQEEEVEEIRWFSKEELIQEIKSNSEEFIPKMKDYIKLLS